LRQEFDFANAAAPELDVAHRFARRIAQLPI
jgi:hypothetical protein